jgi:hypothetical protein
LRWRLHRIAHGGEIDHRRDAGEILQQHAAGHEGNLFRRNALALPRSERANVIGLHRFTVLAAQQVFQQNAERIRQVLDAAAVLLDGVQTIDLKLALAHAEDGTTAKTVHG